MPEVKPLTNKLILELKEILERKNGRPYSYDEAARIGRSLVGLFSELADNPAGIGHVKNKGGADDDSLQIAQNNR